VIPIRTGWEQRASARGSTASSLARGLLLIALRSMGHRKSLLPTGKGYFGVPVEGSMMVEISVILVAGNPLSSAWRRITASSLAR